MYFGVKPNGEVIGQTVNESSLRDVSRAIYESIKPQVYPAIQKEMIGSCDIIRVEVNGTEAPYSAYGRYYIRTADEDREVMPSELKSLFSRTTQADPWDTLDSGRSINEIDKAQLKKVL